MSDSQQRILRTILTGMPGILALQNGKSVFEVVNPPFMQFIGKSMEEILGHTPADLFPKAEADAALKDDKAVMKSGVPRSKEQQLTGKDGTRWFDLTRTPVLDDNGDPTGILLTGHDITEFKEREERIKTFEAERAALEKQIEEARAKAAQETQQANAAAQAAQAECDRLKQELAAAAQSLQTASAGLETQKAAAAQAQAALENDLKAAQVQCRQIDAARAAVETKLDEISSQHSALAHRLEEAQAQRDALHTALEQSRAAQNDAAALAKQLLAKLGAG